MAVTMKNVVFWDVTLCGSSKNQRCRGTYRFHHQGARIVKVPSSQTLVPLMMEVICSSESSVLTRTTRRNSPEDDILHSHRRENLKPDNNPPCAEAGT
jgi:hypothetical protein